MWRSMTLAVASVLIASGVAFGTDWADKMFEVKTHDFGSVARSAKAEFEFVLTNLYQEDIHIAGVRTSCGCTTPSVTKSLLKTYEKGAVVAKFNTQSFLGSKGATLTVTIDRPAYAEVQLRVDGFIRSDVYFTPGSVQLGTVEQGAPATKKVSVTYAGWSNWQATEVRSANPHIKAQLVETGRYSNQVSYDVLVTLDKAAPAGYLKEQILLMTNDQNSPQIPLAVEGRVMSSVTVSPASLFLGVVQPGQKVTKQLVVQGKKPFKITGIFCDDESFQFTKDDAEKTLHMVPVTFTAKEGKKSGKVSKSIRIETDLGTTAQELSAQAMISDK
jgi:hypothetical protein